MGTYLFCSVSKVEPDWLRAFRAEASEHGCEVDVRDGHVYVDVPAEPAVGDLLNRLEADALPEGSVVRRDDGDGKEYLPLVKRKGLWISARCGGRLGSGQWRVLNVGGQG